MNYSIISLSFDKYECVSQKNETELYDFCDVSKNKQTKKNTYYKLQNWDYLGPATLWVVKISNGKGKDKI